MSRAIPLTRFGKTKNINPKNINVYVYRYLKQMSQLDYSSFHQKPLHKKNTEGSTPHMDKIALANRPLSTSTLPIHCDTCSSHIQSSTTSYFKSNNGIDLLNPRVANIENRYTHQQEEPISVVMKKNNHGDNRVIDVLTDDHSNDSDYYIGDFTSHNTIEHSDYKYTKMDKPESDKMDVTTQIYIGSITVVTLFLVYRLLEK